jgi:hypothetical protein
MIPAAATRESVRVDFPAKEQRSNPAQQRISHIKAQTFKNRSKIST